VLQKVLEVLGVFNFLGLFGMLRFKSIFFREELAVWGLRK